MDNDKDVADPSENEFEGVGEAEVPEDETPEEDAEGDDHSDADGEDESQGNGEQDTRGRANSRIRSLNSEKKEAKERADKAERELSDLRRQMEEVRQSLHAGNAVKNAAAEQELLAQMDPVQRVQYEADKKIDAVHSELRKVQLSALDNSDKATFLAKAQNDPVRSRYSDQVEKNLADMRAKGFNAPREDVYAFLLGKSLIEQKTKSNGKNNDRAAARARVDATQGRSTSVRSDAPSSRKGKTAEERLSNIAI